MEALLYNRKRLHCWLWTECQHVQSFQPNRISQYCDFLFCSPPVVHICLLMHMNLKPVCCLVSLLRRLITRRLCRITQTRSDPYACSPKLGSGLQMSGYHNGCDLVYLLRTTLQICSAHQTALISQLIALNELTSIGTICNINITVLSAVLASLSLPQKAVQ